MAVGPPLYVTTPIYYVNADPHIGHAYTSVICDAACRFAKLDGRESRLVTGTDEHGEKVEESAKAKGMEPLEFATQVSRRFQTLADTYDVGYDRFIRTTEAQHKDVVVDVWNRLVDRGHIYLGQYEGWYCVRDECFYTDSELVEGKAPTGAEVEWRAKEASYFFKLSAWTEPLLQLYEDNPDLIQPTSRRNEVVAFLKEGLRDLSISRTSFKWGIGVPEDEEHVMYVWVDALCNYLTAAEFMVDGQAATADFNKWWPGAAHVIGKDILRFHGVYWPALLMAAGLPPPRRLFVHGWWTKDGQKISKSLGNTVEPFDLVRDYGVDACRYFLLSEVPFGNDGDFSQEVMLKVANGYLANAVGNYAQRVTTMIAKNCDGLAPEPPSNFQPSEDDLPLLEAAQNLAEAMRPHMEDMKVHLALRAVEAVVRDANRHFDASAPWLLKKNDPARMREVLAVSLEVTRCVALAYQPFMPRAMDKLLTQIGVPEEAEFRTFEAIRTQPVPFETRLNTPEAIFPRIDATTLAAI
ncbi:methionyl-tRNA synthetase [Pelagophyceae sp. CCMP2097]|nr:methionyl-tRNA synthetase [Pelagophyceae sp. CCMP2097]